MFKPCVYLASLLLVPAVLAKPVIGTDGVVNVASYQPSGFPNSGIAQGSLFVVFGSGMGPSTLQGVSSFPLPKKLGGTSISVTVGGTTIDAIMIYTSAGQVAALLPSTVPTGTGTLTLTYNDSASDPAPIQVVAHSVGIFTLNQGGNGPAVVTFPNSPDASTLLKSTKPGQIVTLWATGLGAISGDETVGPPAGDMSGSVGVKVYVGNVSAPVLYAGRAPGLAGLDQINFTVPSTVSGCFVPITVQAAGITGNFGSISVDSGGGKCSDPQGPLNQVLQKVDAGQNIRIGLVQLSRFGSQFNLPQVGTITVNQDSGTGFFYEVTPQQFLGSLGVASLNTFGACVVWTCRGVTCVPPTQSGGVPALDAGSALTVSGPDGTKQIPKTSGYYSAALGGGSLTAPNFLDPGSYTVTGPGGSGSGAVGGFTATQSISASPVTWTASQQSTISRSVDTTVNWTGGSPDGYVAIIGTSTSNTPQVTGTFACTAKSTAGTFTIPKWVLSTLPVTGTLTQSGITVSNGFLLMGNYSSFNAFNAPGLDLGFFTNLVLSGQNAQFQ